MMPPELQAKLDFLVSRLKRGRGNQDVLVAEIIKTFNSRPARRQTDARVQGWTYLETGA